MSKTAETAGLFGRWVRFFVGLALLLGFAWFLSRGYAPPGIAGEVIRNNLHHGIDATPMFYTEIEQGAFTDYSGFYLDP